MSRLVASSDGRISVEGRRGSSRPRDGPAQQVLCRDSRQGPFDGKVSNRSIVEKECNLKKMIKVGIPFT